ncbi:hypothetical protein SJAG_03784 [Schizosaccharomyces japonicus yFS275]|uniref:CS domain-containing protein n=1 Tax=Schizosaccharomyces japonicus (strain yFS275 / FY16936) TaxID=402676 RepID=B6K518_SCHJY|nr:hypothetical protein SJAG_03784 [Schizosaccharomyces japonicus yFS275]EEB08622.1 hypothetical protein SJAG_03784 [Schizosaccharomyces japonicus yFS275]
MSTVQIPEVLWAQRSNAEEQDKNVIYLTVMIPDSVSPSIDVENDKLKVEAKSANSTHYAVEIPFFKEIIPEKSKYHVTGRCIYFVLYKKDAAAEFWPRLTKEKARLHWLKTDFDRWVDEDEQEEVAEPANPFGAGMPDFSNMDFSQFAKGEDDSDDSSEPELEEEDKTPESK